MKSLNLRSNKLTWISPSAFDNLTGLAELDISYNQIKHLSSNVLTPAEIRMTSLKLSGNPFQCDCLMLSLWEWLQEHGRLIHQEESPLVCVHPEKLRDHSILTLHPSDICPSPLVSDLEVQRLDSNHLSIAWEVQNGTLIGGFTVTYHITNSRSPVVLANLQATARQHELEDLVPETWYSVCVTATGKYLRIYGNKPTPYVTENERTTEVTANNRKCLQIRTLAKTDKTKITLSTLGIILGSSISAALVLTLSILLTALKFRRRRRRPVKNDVPQEYISYRHFSIQSSEGVYS
ncbi:hypothetical protein TNIN_307971 [Trichonephila inaurata madagascariensis]|uniref:Fibronectin type-III domain-containing protein n=1 Tax=Trichonephila inaurata madagascariensis TaxID=2747483 RepID=A0A8X6XT08_9ARAC|nr:hypothetical protein TNIN_307971 [Trichonephila inaurata madagascariensis]